LEAKLGLRFGESFERVRDAARQTAELLQRLPREAPWIGYLAVRAESHQVVGICGFKDAPTHAGDVEIAYFTFPLFEGQGCASAMAAELVNTARSSPLVRQVIAHTLPERNASCRVLEKNGFHNIGEVIDPEDGLVWRWERNP
jgi:RimJ/RimL family protein N-acetyltransferase